MPARLARSSVSISKPHNARKKHQKRNLEAFAIASHEVPSTHKIRQHRLGEAEDDAPRKKRRRMADDDDEGPGSDDEEGPSNASRLERKKVKKGRFDELDVDSGEDSEGHHWRYGEVDEDDDEDIDSDEAFGESDEEKFEGFTFRGSAGGKGSKGSKRTSRDKHLEEDFGADVDLNEDEMEPAEASDEDDLGDDAIDLATALDQYEEEGSDDSDDGAQGSGEGEESEEDTPPSDYTMSDDEDTADPKKLLQLRHLISTLDAEAAVAENKKKARRGQDVHETRPENAFGITRTEKLSLEDLGASTKRSTKVKGLDAPLPKRQQDRLDRIAANEKAKETLDRWIDTVKHNRRADHLEFPLRNPSEGEALGTSKLLPTSQDKPQNDLESTIQKILTDSGLAQHNKTDEDQIRAFEELKTNKMSLEDVQARRAELRKARDLLFREEVRAKRIKKIKSKSYRRVHRKERERMAEKERQALVEAGVEMSEDEKERQDRRRAEERMGAKHRESKWAKSVKSIGRAAWDEDARAGVTEMARRNEELRRRMQGKEVVGNEDQEPTDPSDDEDEEERGSDESDDAFETRRLRTRLERMDQEGESSGKSKLASMNFMQRAEAARKAQNDEELQRIRRELDGEESPEEEEPESLGRRVFGPTSVKLASAVNQKRNEFEEKDDSDTEKEVDGDEVEIVVDGPDAGNKSQKRSQAKKSSQKKSSQPKVTNYGADNPWLDSSTSTRSKKSTGIDVQPDNPWITDAPIAKPKEARAGAGALISNVDHSRDGTTGKKSSARAKETVAPADADGWTVVTHAGEDGDSDDAEDSDDGAEHLPFVLRNKELVSKAFAGDEVATDFAAEKRALIEEEGDKVIDNTLPGWGTWVGEGIGKKAQARNKGRFLEKVEGIKPQNRKDAKLDKVIINEKRVKKNAKYLATQLPHPFETKEQYERSLRLPVGPEWQTKKSFQDTTKPRVIVKKGVVIAPMERPML